MDALGQTSVSVPQKSSCACAAMGIDQMWVWELPGAGWDQQHGRSSAQVPRTFREPSGTALCQLSSAQLWGGCPSPSPRTQLPLPSTGILLPAAALLPHLIQSLSRSWSIPLMTEPIFLPQCAHWKFLMTPVGCRTGSKGPYDQRTHTAHQ